MKLKDFEKAKEIYEQLAHYKELKIVVESSSTGQFEFKSDMPPKMGGMCILIKNPYLNISLAATTTDFCNKMIKQLTDELDKL